MIEGQILFGEFDEPDGLFTLQKKGGLYILPGLESASAALRAKAEHACQGINEVLESLPY